MHDEKERAGSRREAAGGGAIGDALRHWPVVLVVVLAALVAATVSLSRRDVAYRVSATVLVTPLPQWDDTFLGVSLVRDAGDSSRTTETVATLLESEDAAVRTARALGDGWTAQGVEDAVEVQAVRETNLVRISAEDADAERAHRLASAYVEAALESRWMRIARELDERIDHLSALRQAAGSPDEITRQVGILQGVRRAGADPTLSHRRTTRAEEVTGVAAPAVVVLAALGGLVLGGLAAASLGALRRRLGGDRGVRAGVRADGVGAE